MANEELRHLGRHVADTLKTATDEVAEITNLNVNLLREFQKLLPPLNKIAKAEGALREGRCGCEAHAPGYELATPVAAPPPSTTDNAPAAESSAGAKVLPFRIVRGGHT